MEQRNNNVWMAEFVVTLWLQFQDQFTKYSIINVALWNINLDSNTVNCEEENEMG